MKIKETLACIVVIGLSGVTVRGADSGGYFPKYHSNKSNENTRSQTGSSDISSSSKYAPYLALRAGIAQPRDASGAIYSGGSFVGNTTMEFEPGLALSVAGGVQKKGESITSALELELLGQTNERKNSSATLNQASLWLNGIIGITTESSVTPYFLGGFGLTRLVYDAPFAEPYATEISAQLGLGLEIDLSEDISLDLGYRFYAADTATLTANNDSLVFNSSGHRFMAGINFQF